MIEQLLPHLLDWGIEGCYIGKLSLANLDLPEGLKRAADWGAHVYNQNALTCWRTTAGCDLSVDRARTGHWPVSWYGNDPP
jgi:hypothetical protein